MKGQNFRLFVGGKPIALSTECEVHIAIKTEDGSTKDTTGDWDVNEVVGKSWDCSVSSLTSFNTDSTANMQAALISLMIAGDPVAITFNVTSGANNRVVSGTAKFSGSALITDCTIKAANKTNVTGSFKFTGTGALSNS